MTALLEVRDLSKAFGGVKAVSKVSFSVAAGELLAMIGPNGAGKSTCFNMLNGQLRPTQGQFVCKVGSWLDSRPARSGVCEWAVRFKLPLPSRR